MAIPGLPFWFYVHRLEAATEIGPMARRKPTRRFESSGCHSLQRGDLSSDHRIGDYAGAAAFGVLVPVSALKAGFSYGERT